MVTSAKFSPIASQPKLAINENSYNTVQFHQNFQPSKSDKSQTNSNSRPFLKQIKCLLLSSK